MADSSSVLTEYTRLHITPFDSTLVNAILPPSILPNARNISYHTLETFPDKVYGYVDLPKMDAEKIKKKLNGSILKGTKVRVEAARPEWEFVPQPQDDEAPKPRGAKERKESRKRKRGEETIPAVELKDRSVKRGWTTPTAAVSKKDKSKDRDGKAVVKSKYTTGPECLFKTVLPPNVAANTIGKDSKDGLSEKKKRKVDKGTVVHEFAKTTKYATFLRGPAGSKKMKGVAEFVEGKGWIDEDGNVVEERIEKPPRSREPQMPAKKAPVEVDSSMQEDESSEESSSSEDEDSESILSEEEAAEERPMELDTAPQVAQEAIEDSPTSSSGSSSEEESESNDSSSEDDSEGEAKTAEKSNLPSISISRPQSSSGPPSGLSIKIPTSTISSTPVTREVHPLEALYKRPRPDSLGSLPKPAIPSFSFFGEEGDEDLEAEEAQDQVPLTPFTQRDFEFRGLRSAAPTPDTAHANKRFIWPTDNDDDDEEDNDDGANSPVRRDSLAKSQPKEAKSGEAESDFQKWFYENRGETTRAWKKRRKVVAKEKRQRENRTRKDRAF